MLYSGRLTAQPNVGTTLRAEEKEYNLLFVTKFESAVVKDI